MISDPVFYLCAVPAVLITGLSKGGLGGGLGVVAVPMMALAISPIQAAGIHLPILCLMDVVGIWVYWRKWDRPAVSVLLGGAVAGIALGALGFRYLDPAMIKVMVGLIAVAFSLGHWLGNWQGNIRPARGGWIAGVFWGGVSGFTSTVAHAGSPPVSIYLLPRNLQRTVYQATSVVFFMCVNYLKLIPYAWLGQFTPGNLATSAVLVPVAVVGVLSGVWVHNRVSEALFYRLCYAFLLLVGVKLLWDGGAALLR